MNDRRKQPRKSTSDYFLIYDDDSDRLLGRVLDLTTEGTMMISEEQVEVPQKFTCRMVMPRLYGTLRHITFDIESIRSQKNKERDWYETGYRIVDLSPENRRIINQILSEWVIKKQSGSAKIIVGQNR